MLNTAGVGTLGLLLILQQWESGSIAPGILNLSTTWSGQIHTRAVIPQVKGPEDRRLCKL
jgi:hypothetical protein